MLTLQDFKDRDAATSVAESESDKLVTSLSHLMVSGNPSLTRFTIQDIINHNAVYQVSVCYDSRFRCDADGQLAAHFPIIGCGTEALVFDIGSCVLKVAKTRPSCRKRLVASSLVCFVSQLRFVDCTRCKKN
jgi:hypothetical protein